MHRLLIAISAVAACAACQPQGDQCGAFADGNSGSPMAPTTVNCGPVLHNQPGTVAGGEGGSASSGDTMGGDAGAEGATPEMGTTATVTEFGVTIDGDTVYMIGRGDTFRFVGGEATMVWCRPSSGCMGEGIDRSMVDATFPPDGWASEGYAFFRRAGTTGGGLTFEVDGRLLSFTF